MALSRPWYIDANVKVNTFGGDTSTALNINKATLWSIKAFLKGEIGTNTQGLWTCVGSSDGVTFSATDNVDRWGFPFDPAKLVSASGATNHSWIILKSPNSLGPYYMILDYFGSAVGTGTHVIIMVSSVAYSGGSLTARPTNTAEFGNTTAIQFSAGAALNKVHRVTDADGNFWFLVNSGDFPGIFTYSLGLQKLIEVRAGDQQPLLLTLGYTTSGRGANSNSAGGLFNSTGTRMRNPIATGNLAVDPLHYSIGGTALWLQSGANNIDGQADLMPIYIYSNTVPRGIRGRIPDCSIIASQYPVGATVPLGATPEQVVVGNILIPFPAIPLI